MVYHLKKTKAKKKKRRLLVAVLILLAVILAAVAVAWFLGLIPFFQGGDGNGDGGDGDGGDDGGNGIISFNLTVNPSAIDREGEVVFTVTSNLANAQIVFQAQLVGRAEWATFTPTYTTSASGGYTLRYDCVNAGNWFVRAMQPSTEATSNTISLTVYGITIYQQKGTWQTGEEYTAALTGTYKSWMVSIWTKDDVLDPGMWHWAMNVQTDANGAIDYGIYTAVIDPAQAGSTKNVIAVISPTDATGQDVVELFQQVETIGIISETDLDNFAQQGLVVESNILTVMIT